MSRIICGCKFSLFQRVQSVELASLQSYLWIYNLFIPAVKVRFICGSFLFQRSRSPEPASPRVSRGLDDSVIFSPPDGVVMRRKNIKKFNTVAYRGDSRPNKWKRASINGHIYNFDVSLYCPTDLSLA